DCAHWVSAEAALEAGKAHEAVLHAARVRVESPQRPRALLVLSKGLVESGSSSDRARAVETLQALLKASPRDPGAPEASLLLAGLHEARGEWDQAAKRYDRMITDMPLAAQTDEALSRLKAAKPKASAEVQAYITEQTHPQYLSKLRALFAAHRSEDAVAAGQRYLKSLEPRSELACEAVFLVGRSLTKLRQHAESVGWYDRLIEECPKSEWALKAYYLAGKAYWNTDEDSKAVARFEELVAKFPEHSYADDALLYIARIYRAAGKTKAARRVLKRQVKQYPKGDMLKDAHWLMVRDAVAKKRHDAVIAYVDSVEDPGEHDLYSRGRLAYFKARALEEKGRKKEARLVYAEVVGAHPLGYYALLALHGVARIDGVKAGALGDLCAEESELKVCPKVADKSKAKAPKLVLPRALAEDAQFIQGAWLLRMGLGDLARRAFVRARRAHAADEDVLWSMALLLDAAGAYPWSHDIPRRAIDGWQDAYPDLESRWKWEVAYPRPFAEDVRAWAKKRGLPVALVWGIMREESGFNPRIESWANARGLMQLMEGTARTVAAADGVEEFSAASLFEPAVAIRLGTAYLAQLSGHVGAHPVLTIAGYNAGWGNVSRWLEQRGKLPLDEFVEDIPYGQTRHYTKRVLTSLWTYQWLYERGRTPAMSFSLP
ncbi:MAG: transglycosylase SLT domain-containing protein, partial [Myxococcota bacterium]